MHAFSGKHDLEARPQDAPEPCTLNHFEPYQELKQHLETLEDTFKRPHNKMHWRPEAATMEQPPKHHGHHGHHGHPEDGREHPHDEVEFRHMRMGPHHPHHHPHDNGQPEEAEFKHMGKGPHHHRHHHNNNKGIPKHYRPQIPPEELALVRDEDKPHHPHGPPPEPFCKVDELEASSTVFMFSPEKFARAGLFLDGRFSHGSHIYISKSFDESLQDVKVNVTLFSGRNDLQKEVKISAFDHKGQYAVQIERGHFRDLVGKKMRQFEQVPRLLNEPPHHPDEPPHHPDEDKKEDCLVYNVDIVFPAHLKHYDDLELHVREARRIGGGEGIEGIEFGSFKAGLGRGAIIFDGLRAKKTLLGVLRGVVMGTYQPSQHFAAGTIHGATKVNIEPVGDKINITAASTFGPASVDIPADSYEGDFTLFNIFGEPSTVQAPNPEDIHVTKYRPTLKSGYYKKEHTGSRIVVSAKVHGGERLSFN
ncbi:MAG: hypothetical protein EXX96DRAFT_548851 [Benjaminiella poitrasii]|nr:MAG: hypothetical protein EXX96DRAFT_548851 [Benjaminiella poitrasii]